MANKKLKKKEIILNLLTKVKPYMINIIIVLSIFFISLYINDIAPFGKYTLAKNDALFQYNPMLYNFIKNIQEGTLTNYSFTNALGNSFIFNYTYYLSSPVNLIALLFKNANSMFLAVIAAKMIIATITSTFYALKKTNNNYVATIISLAYVFSSWFLAYNQTIMWLDAFMMFPLFQYGLEKLMYEHKKYIYIFSLSYIMISNFYLAWIICIYTLAYFAYHMIFIKKENKEKIKNFNTIALSTILSILLSFFYIYMTYDSFINIDLYINKISQDLTTVPVLNIIKAFFTGNKIISLTPYDIVFPNIATSIIFTISLLYYFINNKIDTKERFKNLLVFIFIIVLIYSKPLNYILNCFHVPNGFCFRYSFLISFYMIHIFIQNYKSFDHKIDKKVFFIIPILIILLIIEIVFENIETKIFILNLTSLIIITILLIFYKNKTLYKFIFTTLIIIEIGTSALFNLKSTAYEISRFFTYDSKETNYREVLSAPEKYVLKKYPLMNVNYYNNKNALPYFSSMQYYQVLFDLQTLGCITDVKATLNVCPDNQLFKTIMNIKTKNNYHLEKIYSANKEVLYTELNSEDYFINTNLLFKKINNTNNDFITIEKLKQNKNNKNQYKITKSGKYYLPLKAEYQVIIIGENAYTYDKNIVENQDLNIKEITNSINLEIDLKKNTIIEIKYPSEKDIEEALEIYYFNQDEFIKSYDKLKANQIQYTKYQDNSIEGTITVDKNQIIFTTIPYDKNWNVTIDGKKANKLLILNSLMGIECEPGTHTIKLEYKTHYTIPTIISITTFIGLITKIILDKRKQKKNEN